MKFIYKWLAIIGMLSTAYLYVRNTKSVTKDIKTITNKANSLYEKFSDTIEKNKKDIMDDVKDFEKEISRNKEIMKVKETVQDFVNNVPEKVAEAVEKFQLRVEAKKSNPVKKASKKVVKKATKTLATGVGRIDQLHGFISNKSEITIPEIRKHFSSVSERTLRRDMDKLEKMGVVKQVGKTKNSFYRVL